jgi:hypothetical protein
VLGCFGLGGMKSFDSYYLLLSCYYVEINTEIRVSLFFCMA